MTFPVPEAADDGPHVYLSVGHQQMMTDAMRPLGLSMWQLTALRPMVAAGARLFVEVTPGLVTTAGRTALLDAFGRGDPLTRDALDTLLARGFVPMSETGAAPPLLGGVATPIDADQSLVDDLVDQTRTAIEGARRTIAEQSGDEVFEAILEDLQAMKRLLLDPRSMQMIVAGMDATYWLNEQMSTWLGETSAADTLALSAPGNVTSEMGLALLDVADAVRPHPDVVACLDRAAQHADDGFVDELGRLPGGEGAHDALVGYLDRYGMRCVGEIDITRPRWIEQPTALVPMILGHVRNFSHGEATRRFEAGRRAAEAKRTELLARLRELPDGAEQADQTARMIDRLRMFVGFREFPKYGIIARFMIYKWALLREAEQLEADGVLRAVDDAFFLTFAELRDAVRTQSADTATIDRRRDEFRSFQSLTPPRVLTSAGEGLSGGHRGDKGPAGALVGIAVSGGVVEGRARVVVDMFDADLEPGDILVTTHTDPSWSPLLVVAAGLVTEVGGVMTHGAVIAREYGLPAVVGVEHATRRIRDGQRIRVDGTRGHIELLDRPSPTRT